MSPARTLVVARAAEDVSWVDDVGTGFQAVHVYCKGMTPLEDLTLAHLNTRVLRDVGGRAHTFLNHVALAYDKLDPDGLTLFSGGAPRPASTPLLARADALGFAPLVLVDAPADPGFAAWFEATVGAKPEAKLKGVPAGGAFAVRNARLLARPKALYADLAKAVESGAVPGAWLDAAWPGLLGAPPGAAAPAEALKPGETPPVRVLLAGTHPYQQNGYSRVVYELARRLAARKDLKLTVYGFQKAPDGMRPAAERAVPPEVTVFDAAGAEVPRKGGFNDAYFGTYLKQNPQDVVIIYNDLAVTTMMVTNLVDHHGRDRRARPFALVSYFDQVYDTQRKRHVKMLAEEFDGIIAFSDEWKANAQRLVGAEASARIHWGVVGHGLDPLQTFPVTRRLARHYFAVPNDAFVVLNLNRNTPRKRYDHVVMAYAVVAAEIESRIAQGKTCQPLRFLIATAMQGAWDIPELFEQECVRLGMPAEACYKYLIGVSAPQSMTDRDVNIMHSVADVHCTMADGEGFGLCSMESAAVGVAQVANAIGGITAVLDDSCALLVKPTHVYHVTNLHDAIGGRPVAGDYREAAAAILKYYDSPVLRASHGQAARKKITTSQDFSWDALAARFGDYALAVHAKKQAERESEAPVVVIKSEQT